jgi:hypothetical protein
VSATRETNAGFFQNTALGRSISLYSLPNVELRLFECNTVGLPRLYNRAIEESKDSSVILVFIHDDVHLCDFFWPARMSAALDRFEIIGVAGNTRRVPRQPSWALIDENLTLDTPEYFSGVVGQGDGFPPRSIDFFGDPGQEVKLLDGLMLASHSSTLISRGLRFDERFDFHFYDLDFCRQADLLKIKMGTCAVSLVHQSTGNLNSEEWRSAYVKYLEKWKS